MHVHCSLPNNLQKRSPRSLGKLIINCNWFWLSFENIFLRTFTALGSSTERLTNCIWPVITTNWMVNYIVFIIMVTHQCAFTPRIPLQGKALYKLCNVAYLSAVALFANPQVTYFRNFLIQYLQVNCRVWRPYAFSVCQNVVP